MVIIKAIDTSGSVYTERDWPKVLREVSVGDHVVMFDTQVYDCGVMESEAQIRSLEIKGGGRGVLTSLLFWCLAREEPVHFIIITDGFLTSPHVLAQFLQENRHRVRFSPRYLPYFFKNPVEKMLPHRKEYLAISEEVL